MSKMSLRTGMAVVISLFLIHCSSDKKRSQIDELEKEVMDIHNKVMPGMGEVARLKDELEKKKESLDSMATEQAQAINDLLLELSAANDGMMNWMRNYSGDFTEMAREDVKKYLEDQKKAISDVQDRISRAVEAAKKELQIPD